MNRYPNTIGTHLFTVGFFFVTYAITWFSLWNISGYLVSDIHLASLFLPVGLRLAALLLVNRRLWWVLIICELLLNASIINALDIHEQSVLLLLSPFLSLAAVKSSHSIWAKLSTYWERLLGLCAIVILNGLVQALAILLLSKPLQFPLSMLYSTTIASITGGMILAPFFYLLHDYLKQNVWEPLTPSLVHKTISLRPSAFLWILTFFCIGLVSELALQEQLTTLLLIVVLLPNIFMAYRYGWQGGVLAAVMNSILLTAAKKIIGSFSSYEELQLFLTTQALVGLGLGIAISRQHLLSEKLSQLNRELEHELDVKRNLTKQLVQVEEDIRKSVARELHDEIGQNITAIQIQATLANRITKESQTQQIATAINQLAMKIHTATRQLLHQLRPQILDELGFESALRQLSREMKFAERGISFTINIGFDPEQLDEVTRVTLYRIVQELLNNTTKYARATAVHLTLLPGKHFSLDYWDNGSGIPEGWRSIGTGLKGIEERVNALGGNVVIKGSRVTVNLPTKTISNG